MVHSTFKRSMAIVLCTMLVLSLLQSTSFVAYADECPVHGQHKLDGAVMFEAEHPHKQYVVCDCGYAQYTGGTVNYYAECDVCNPKDCPVYGQHKLDGAVMFEAEHPHKQYVVCDCGYAQYTGGTVSYYAECDVCNPQECQHLHTDVAWDMSRSMKYVSISDTQHQVTGYQYVYCTDCFEHIGDSYLVTENSGHYFDSNGDCPSCGYTHACLHSNTKLVALDGYPAYKSYDETQHIVDIQYREECLDCGATTRQIVDSARYYEREDHNFNNKGVCRDCGYIKPEEQEELKISVNADQSSAVAGDTISAIATATGGDGSYSFAWKVTCNGSTVANTDLSFGDNYSVLTSESGNYVFTATVRDGNGDQVSASSNAIIVEEPACLHPTTEVAWDTNYPIKYVSISDTEHEMTGYQYHYCLVCFERVGIVLQ